MIIKSFEIFTFKIPLKNPIKISNSELTVREGLILKILDEHENIGIGEISPLPGLHPEKLNDAKNQLDNVLKNLINKKLSLNLAEPLHRFSKDLATSKLFPSVQFGIDSALLSLQSKNQNIPYFHLFNINKKKSVKINALLSGSKEEILKKTDQYLKNGFTTFKLKVGRNKLDDDINLISTINKIIAGNAFLRLDANQAWTLEQATFFFQNVDLKNIEYIEDPLKRFIELPELLKIVKIPIALDENIHEFQKLKFSPSALIIKPSVIGGIEKSLQLINFAEKNNMKAVISDTFHSGVGLSTLIGLSLIVMGEVAMGFDTYSWITEDILTKRIEFRSDKILLDSFELFENLDYSKLKKI